MKDNSRVPTMNVCMFGESLRRSGGHSCFRRTEKTDAGECGHEQDSKFIVSLQRRRPEREVSWGRCRVKFKYHRREVGGVETFFILNCRFLIGQY